MPTFTISPGTSIQTTINGASNGDTILLNPGTYTNDTVLIINKSLTIAWATPSYISYDGVINYANPSAQPVVNLLGGGPFVYLIDFQANNITLSGIAFNNNSGGGVNNGYVFSSVTISNLTINYCDFGFFRRVLFENTVNGLIFTNNTVHDTRDSAIEIDTGVSNINVSYNQFWNETYNYHGEGAINMFYGANIGTCQITYNYASSYRGGIAVQPQGAAYPLTGTMLIAHNTIDMSMATVHEDPIIYDLTLFGLNFFCSPGFSTNGAVFTVKDNLVTRCKSYGVYLGQSGTQNNLASSMAITNNLFYDESWYCNADAPSTALIRPIGEPVASFQYPEPSGSPGSWGSGGANDMPGTGSNSLVDVANIFGFSPLYVESGSVPAQYYGLQDYSPAANSASDGKNIGAWQGTVLSEKLLQDVPEYSSLSWGDSLIRPLPVNKQ